MQADTLCFMAVRGAYAKGVAKREEILITALDVIAKQGYRRASVRELADAVGLSPAGLLHYFDSKEELFTAILRTRDEHDVRLHGTDGGGLETLLAVIRHNATVPGLVWLYVQLSAEAAEAEHPAHSYFVERTARSEELFRTAVVAEQHGGTIRPDLDPDWVATTLHALADGLQSLWLLNPALDMASHLEGFLDSLRPAA